MIDKEKIANKLFDALLVLIASIITIILKKYYSPYIGKFIKFFDLDESNAIKIETIFFSFMVALIYVVILIMYWFIKSLFSVFSRPEIKVEFFNNNDEPITTLYFNNTLEDIKYLKISLKSKFNKLQLYLLNKYLNANLKISINPKMCTIELYEGFIAKNLEYHVKDNDVVFDFFSKYSPSKNEKNIIVELNIMLMHLGEGEAIVSLEIPEYYKFRKLIFEKYCKINVSQLDIKGVAIR